MNTACHYAIARFTPFIETGEFANIGVVIFAPDKRYFGFKLLNNNFARLTHFFNGLEAANVKANISGLRDELDRITNLMDQPDMSNRIGIWTDLIKPRETMLRFSEPRIALAQDCRIKLLELYNYYVEHETTCVR